jgi:hypothetical protein
MFRITRGHTVQHIHFPLPVYGRDLDAAEDEAEPSAESVVPAAEPAESPRANSVDSVDSVDSV